METSVNLQATDWAMKYRPSGLEEMILPASIKRALIAVRDRQIGPSMMFHGPAGVGKTLAATRSFPQDRCSLHACSPDDTSRSIDMPLHQGLGGFRPTPRRLVILDNADLLAPKVQAEVLQFMDTFYQKHLFILTVKDPSRMRLMGSHVVPVDLGRLAGDPELRAEMVKRAQWILSQENIECDPSIVKGIVHRHFPDLRRTINQLQFEIGLAA